MIRGDNIDYIKNIYGARTDGGWLSFFHPRLLLAKDFLTEEGVIFISIDDNAQAQLKVLCDEVFGQENFISTLTWEKGRKNDAKFFFNGHEYMLVYAKSQSYLRSENISWTEYLALRQAHGDDDSAIERNLQDWYASLPRTHAAKKWNRYERIDVNGPWRDRDIPWPESGGPQYNVLHDKNGQPCKVPDAAWRYSTPEELQRQIALGLVAFHKAHIRPLPQELEPALIEDDGEDETEEELATQVRGSETRVQTALTDNSGALLRTVNAALCRYEQHPIQNAVVRMKSLYKDDFVPVDSQPERYTVDESHDQSIAVFAKLPKIDIPTPAGNYNPDFGYALMGAEGEAKSLYLVVETKGYDNMQDIPVKKRRKIDSAKAFFKALRDSAIPTHFEPRLNADRLTQMIKQIQTLPAGDA